LAERLAPALQTTSPGHGVGLHAVDKLKAQGTAYGQLIVSTSAVTVSVTALIPCQRTQLVVTGNAGASAQLFRLLKNEASVDFLRQEKQIVVPPIKASSG